MASLLIIIPALLWLLLGVALYRPTLGRVTSRWSRLAESLAKLVYLAVWLVAPLADEVLGAREFQRLCEEMPAIKFHGAIAVGPGVFFDEAGNRRWASREQLLSIKRSTDDWDKLFGQREQWVPITRWPVPVYERRITLYDTRSGQASVESFFRTSPGGWLRRAVGSQLLGTYQCPVKGPFPTDEERIAFH
jgi:hypothetical protein